MFIKGTGNWIEFRKRDSLDEVDFHVEGTRPGERQELSYGNKMEGVQDKVLTALQRAQERGIDWVLFTHGNSTSRPGKETARSVIRNLMRGSQATPYIVRKESIQHESVFLARIKRK